MEFRRGDGCVWVVQPFFSIHVSMIGSAKVMARAVSYSP
jgi:hypothetical protein